MARRKHNRDPFAEGQSPTVTVVERPAIDLFYNYDNLPEANREAVKKTAVIIKPRLKRAAEDIFVIGKELSTIKEKFPHGEYTNWLDIEFGLSTRMAQRFVNVFERLGSKSDKLSDLSPSTLYLLAAKSTPDTAIEDIQEQIENGERVSVAYVHRIISSAKQEEKLSDTEADVIDGEVTSSEVIADESQDRINQAKRLDKILSQAFELLSGQPAEEWAELFHDSELSRVRNEIYQLRKKLQKNVLRKE